MSQPGSRPYTTMPVGGQRNSMPVPSPYQNGLGYQNGALIRTPSYGSSINTSSSPQVESAGSQPAGMTKGEQEEWRSKRYSAMTTGTFGMKLTDQLESLAEHDQVGFQYPNIPISQETNADRSQDRLSTVVEWGSDAQTAQQRLG